MSDFDRTSNAREFSRKLTKASWRCVAITLDPGGKRYKSFLRNNNHLQIETFHGFKGEDIPQDEIINRKLATKELAVSPLLTPGAIGCAASHKSIWNTAATEGKGYFILEDDCYTHQKTTAFINDNLDLLMDIDICFFGINTDSILQSISPLGLSSLSLFQPKHPSEEWIKNALSKTNTKEVALHRLIKAFGFCAYFISPTGAKKLIEKIFPLSLETTNIPLITEKMPAISIDRAGCREYPQLKACTCQPFLAYTPNINSTTKK